MATITTVDGNELCSGLPGCDHDNGAGLALRAAQERADGFGEDVVLHDDDGIWLVHPASDGYSREAADDITDSFADEE